jgi:hypothetical protein
MEFRNWSFSHLHEIIEIQNMAGKDIGRATGFKLAQLQELENGEILKVGGREVLVSSFKTNYKIVSVELKLVFLK